MTQILYAECGKRREMAREVAQRSEKNCLAIPYVASELLTYY